MTATGSAAALLGMTTYFMSYEYKDFDRVDLQDKSKMDSTFHRRKRFAEILQIISALVYIGGIVVLVLGMSLYTEEREAKAFDIPTLFQQIREAATQPSINEAAVLASISSVVLVIGLLQCIREFHKTERFGWIGSTLYAAGWLGNGFAASLNNKSISSIEDSRLVWTLPGIAAIVAGTFMFPWQLRNNYISGPAWPLVSIGYVLFSIGNSLVVQP
jgi:hypothetical protein